MNNKNPQDPRPIPPLPGGGSWSFDEAKWDWVSNDPAPEAVPSQPVAIPETPSAKQE